MQPIGVSTHRWRDAALESSARPSQAAPTIGSPRVRPGSPLGFPPLLKGGEKITDRLVARSIPGVPSKFDSGFKLLLKRWCPLECWDVIRMGMQREEILLCRLRRDSPVVRRLRQEVCWTVRLGLCINKSRFFFLYLDWLSHSRRCLW